MWTLQRQQWVCIRNSTLVIFDDLMTEVAHSKFVTKLFAGGSHHQNVTVISVLQNLFPRTGHSVTQQRNTTHYVLMPFMFAQQQVRRVLQYCDATNWRSLYDRYQETIQKENFAKLIIDGSDNWKIKLYAEYPS